VTGRPEPWEELVLAEEAYVARRRALFSSDAEAQLRLALASPRGVGTALRALADAPPELVMSLFDVLFVVAATTHAQVGLARAVLGRLDPGWLASALQSPVEELLARPELGWEEYRRLAELLSALEQRSLLTKVVQHAALSDDDDVREVAEDFGK
jgi:hypothetical protein